VGLPLGPEVTIPAAAAAGGVLYLRRRYRAIPDLPSSVRLTDPVPSPEGVFYLGIYQHTPATPSRWDWHTQRRELARAAWRPWDGGEQHLEILGTTNAGKTEAGGLLAATVGQWPGWDLFIGDGMGGEDFTWAKDARLGVVCRTDASISKMLAEAVREIERRVAALGNVRVPRTDSTGIQRAVAPKNVRMLTRAQREKFGLRPRLYVLDELPALLLREKARASRLSRKKTDEQSQERRYPILEYLMQFAAQARKVGIHIAALAQRNDAEILDGFTGSLFRARVLIGSTDQVAETMAHGGQASVWKELAAEAGYESDGLERAMRPAGRALVSGIERRPAALVQLYHFDTDTRAPTMADWETSQAPPAPAPDPPSPVPPSAHPASSPSRPLPVLSLVGSAVPGLARARSEAPGVTLAEPVSPPTLTPLEPSPDRPRGRLGRFLARRLLALSVWRYVLFPTVTPLARPYGLRDRVGELYGTACACCRAPGRWEAAHRRARRLRGSDDLKNMMPLCLECHDLMSKAEDHMIAWRRRPLIVARRLVVGGWSRRSRMPHSLWPYVGAACFGLGLLTDQWKTEAAIVGAAFAFGPPVIEFVLLSRFKALGPMLVVRSNRSTAEVLQRRARAQAREGRGTFMDAKADASAAAEYGWSMLRASIIGMSGAYLLGVFGPGLVF